MHIDKWEDNAIHKPERTLLRATLWIVGIVCLVCVLVYFGYLGFRKATYKVEAEQQKNETIYNADNQIYNYEWFHNKYEAVKAADVQIDNAKVMLDTFVESAGARADWKFDDRQEFSRLNSILTGLKNHRAQLVADYNARSKQTTRNIFKDNNLPARLE